MDYLDFELAINLSGGREYEISVRSPAGEARELMRFPFDKLVLENRLLALQNALLNSGGTRRQYLSPHEKVVQTFGQELFDYLIANEVRSRYDVSQRLAREADKGLRLVLKIREPKLAALPWEFLFDPRRAKYVCLSRNTPIVRYTDLSATVDPLIVKPPLRILGMAVSPADLDPLDIEREKQRVEEGVRRLEGLVSLTWLEGQTWQDLQEAMQGGPWHIFHFIGHGGFNRTNDEGLIVLSNDDGQSFELSATNLADLLDQNHLKLVLLNACEGARGSNVDIFSSTASILVRSGVPAVLAMQYEITDDAAIEFSRSFYRAVARGMPLEAAVSEGRKAISIAVNNTVEWGTPVLYLHAQNGRLFDIDLKLEQVNKIFEEAKKAIAQEDWGAAIEKLQAVLHIDALHEEARAALEQALEQKKLSESYAKAQACYEAGDLQGALGYLREVESVNKSYKETAALTSKIEERLREDEIANLNDKAKLEEIKENQKRADEPLVEPEKERQARKEEEGNKIREAGKKISIYRTLQIAMAIAIIGLMVGLVKYLFSPASSSTVNPGAAASRNDGSAPLDGSSGPVNVTPNWSFQPLETISAGFDIHRVALSREGDLVAAVGNRDNVYLWSTTEHKQLSDLASTKGQYGSVAIKSVGDRIVVSGGDDKRIRFWRPGENTPFIYGSITDRFIFFLDFTSDGQKLVSASANQAGNKLIEVWQETGGRWSQQSLTKIEPTEKILAISTDRLLVALSTNTSNEIELRSLSGDGFSRRTTLSGPGAITSENIVGGAASRDGRMLALAIKDNGRVKIVLLQLKDTISSETVLRTEGDEVQSMAFAPDNQLFAAGWSDGTIHIWRMDNDQELSALQAGTLAIRHIVFSGNGKILAAAKADKTISLWQVKNNPN